MPPQRIAVIGGVAAGPAAAAQAKRIDPDAEVVLFEQGPDISYGACEMPYYVAEQVEGTDLIQLTPEQFEQSRKACVRVHHRVLALRPRRNRLDVKNLITGHISEERFDKFILAVGAEARTTGLDGEDAPNVFAMRRLEDARALRCYLDAHTVHHAVILGGGYVGVEMAEALRTRGLRVSILEPRGGLLHTYLDEELQPLVDDAAGAHGVLIRQEQAVAFERDDGGTVRAVVTDRGEKIGCQVVIVAIGVEPNTALAEAADIAVGATGAIAVDAQMRTNLPNVWACGDCVEVERVIDGKKVHLPLSPVAFRTARVAAHNAARRGRNAPARFPGVCVATAVKVFGLEVAAVGLRLEEARQSGFDAFATTIRHGSRVPFFPGAKPLHVRLVAERKKGRLLGAELMGEEGAALRADVLVPCIRAGWTVNQIKDLDLIYTPPLAPALDPLIVAASKAAKRVERT
ncbi:MAG: FAD-dependent oxidoreductase [Rhodothermales bacterium]